MCTERLIFAAHEHDLEICQLFTIIAGQGHGFHRLRSDERLEKRHILLFPGHPDQQNLLIRATPEAVKKYGMTPPADYRAARAAVAVRPLPRRRKCDPATEYKDKQDRKKAVCAMLHTWEFAPLELQPAVA